MVLGNIGKGQVCYYCKKPDHLKKDCFKLQNDPSSRGNGRNQRGGNDEQNGGRNQRVNVMATSQDFQEVVRLGMAAMQNKERQLQEPIAESRKVSLPRQHQRNSQGQ